MRFFLSLSSVVGVKGVLSSSSSQQLCVCERVDSSLCGLSTTLSLSLSLEKSSRRCRLFWREKENNGGHKKRKK